MVNLRMAHPLYFGPFGDDESEPVKIKKDNTVQETHPTSILCHATSSLEWPKGPTMILSFMSSTSMNSVNLSRRQCVSTCFHVHFWTASNPNKDDSTPLIELIGLEPAELHALSGFHVTGRNVPPVDYQSTIRPHSRFI